MSEVERVVFACEVALDVFAGKESNLGEAPSDALALPGL